MRRNLPHLWKQIKLHSSSSWLTGIPTVLLTSLNAVQTLSSSTSHLFSVPQTLSSQKQWLAVCYMLSTMGSLFGLQKTIL